jgi:DNA-binding NtrC family response regulator
MKERILLVGEDPVLLETRALLLSDWETEIKDTHSAIATIATEQFDVVILGQLVTAKNAQLVISSAKEKEPAPEILAIRNGGDSAALGVDTHQIDLLESPAWLKEWVGAALRKRSDRSQ